MRSADSIQNPSQGWKAHGFGAIGEISPAMVCIKDSMGGKNKQQRSFSFSKGIEHDEASIFSKRPYAYGAGPSVVQFRDDLALVSMSEEGSLSRFSRDRMFSPPQKSYQPKNKFNIKLPPLGKRYLWIRKLEEQETKLNILFEDY